MIMTNKKLGFLFLPLLPLSALGIVEVASRIAVPAPVVQCEASLVEVRRESSPPMPVAPPAMPTAAPRG